MVPAPTRASTSDPRQPGSPRRSRPSGSPGTGAMATTSPAAEALCSSPPPRSKPAPAGRTAPRPGHRAQSVWGVAVQGERVRKEAVVGRIDHRGEQEAIEPDDVALVVVLVLVPAPLGDLDHAREGVVSHVVRQGIVGGPMRLP